MKLEPVKKLTFAGEDFKGEYEEQGRGRYDRVTITVQLLAEVTADTVALPPYAHFSNFRDEEDIDRCAAAAKMALREIKKGEK